MSGMRGERRYVWNERRKDMCGKRREDISEIRGEGNVWNKRTEDMSGIRREERKYV